MWKDKLNKKERKHLSESGIRTKLHLRAQRDFIRTCLDKNSKEPRTFVCFECLAILNKLEDEGVVL